MNNKNGVIWGEEFDDLLNLKEAELGCIGRGLVLGEKKER